MRLRSSQGGVNDIIDTVHLDSSVDRYIMLVSKNMEHIRVSSILDDRLDVSKYVWTHTKSVFGMFQIRVIMVIHIVQITLLTETWMSHPNSRPQVLIDLHDDGMLCPHSRRDWPRT
jgi:hypothetical protein